jgi:hypothetical protein
MWLHWYVFKIVKNVLFVGYYYYYYYYLAHEFIELYDISMKMYAV